MNAGLVMAGGIGLGAGLMYLLDPERGRRRRAMLRDKAVSAAHRAADRLDVATRDLSHRAYGLAAETRTAFTGEPAPSDHVLAERVRSALGRTVSHPHAIHIEVGNGRVTVSGPILAREVNCLLDCIASVRGVTSVEDRLDVHERAGNLAALQGGRVIGRAAFQWSPAGRLLACTGGGVLMANCLARRTPGAMLLGSAGFALFVRGLTNLEMTRLLGLNRGRGWLEVHKAITIRAPVEEVFEFWTHYPNFPRFMAHVREVRELGNGRSYWVAQGPAGVRATWISVVTRMIPSELLAWRTEPGSTVANAGIIRFERANGNSTRIQIRLTYHPPAGALGHFAARLFGTDPKSALDDDLVRLKSLLEEGKASAPGKQATREELAPASGGQI